MRIFIIPFNRRHKRLCKIQVIKVEFKVIDLINNLINELFVIFKLLIKVFAAAVAIKIKAI